MSSTKCYFNLLLLKERSLISRSHKQLKEVSVCNKLVLLICLIFFQTNLIEAQQQIFNQTQLITDGRVWDVAFEDLNKDGSTDMVIANWFKAPTIYYNDGNSGFQNEKTLACSEVEDGYYIGHSVGVADFNEDENPDIFYVFNGRNNLIYLSDNGEFTKSDTINTNHSDGLYISLADVDNDNDIDALITNYKQANVLWINDGKGNFIKNSADFDSNGYNADIGDLNKDGNLDVICSISGNVVVWFNRGNNKYEKSTQIIGYAESFGRVKLADMDNDQDLDIVLANRKFGGSVWKNDGSGIFSKPISNLAKSSTMCVGDIDLNGHMDVILGNSIWLNNGNGQFAQHGTLEIEGQILGLWLNDIDNDDDLDLFYATTKVENGLVLLKNATKSNL